MVGLDQMPRFPPAQCDLLLLWQERPHDPPTRTRRCLNGRTDTDGSVACPMATSKASRRKVINCTLSHSLTRSLLLNRPRASFQLFLHQASILSNIHYMSHFFLPLRSQVSAIRASQISPLVSDTFIQPLSCHPLTPAFSLTSSAQPSFSQPLQQDGQVLKQPCHSPAQASTLQSARN